MSPNSRAKKYKQQRDRARSQRDEATAHAILAGRAIGDLQRKLNTKRDKRTNDRSVTVGGRVVTTQEGRAKALEQKQARAEKENKAEENKQKKNDNEFEKRRQRADLGKEGMVFTGALAYQKHPMLVDIAWCMDLDEAGTREQLIGRITAHIDEEPALRADSRFIGLWPSSKRTSKRPVPDEREGVSSLSSSDPRARSSRTKRCTVHANATKFADRSACAEFKHLNRLSIADIPYYITVETPSEKVHGGMGGTRIPSGGPARAGLDDPQGGPGRRSVTGQCQQNGPTTSSSTSNSWRLSSHRSSGLELSPRVTALPPGFDEFLTLPARKGKWARQSVEGERCKLETVEVGRKERMVRKTFSRFK
ncbi:hypothetical protein BC835DRAFT_1310304 [Cytidiella melzeri]|nr:hypothetical protein BC835DRAFT_1310304 [Cytidiella melzeri]